MNPADQHFAIFDTAIGRCALVWNACGLVGVQLPEATEDATRARATARYPQAIEASPDAFASRVIDGIVALLSGGKRDLADISIDDSDTPAFNQRVFKIVRAIPPGQTLTYGEVAERLGDKTLARAVGTAMGQNPCPIVMPCHRVLAASGSTGGFSAPGGVVTKLKILTIEGAQPGGPDLFGDLPLVARTRAG